MTEEEQAYDENEDEGALYDEGESTETKEREFTQKFADYAEEHHSLSYEDLQELDEETFYAIFDEFEESLKEPDHKCSPVKVPLGGSHPINRCKICGKSL